MEVSPQSLGATPGVVIHFEAMLQAMRDAQLQQLVGPRGRLEVTPPETQAAGGTA